MSISDTYTMQRYIHVYNILFYIQPLYVELDEGTVQKILDTLESEESEIKLKSVFVESRDVVANRIAEDLSAYRQKRMLGLGSMYGEQQLTGNQ